MNSSEDDRYFRDPDQWFLPVKKPSLLKRLGKIIWYTLVGLFTLYTVTWTWLTFMKEYMTVAYFNMWVF